MERNGEDMNSLKIDKIQPTRQTSAKIAFAVAAAVASKTLTACGPGVMVELRGGNEPPPVVVIPEDCGYRTSGKTCTYIPSTVLGACTGRLSYTVRTLRMGGEERIPLGDNFINVTPILDGVTRNAAFVRINDSNCRILFPTYPTSGCPARTPNAFQLGTFAGFPEYGINLGLIDITRDTATIYVRSTSGTCNNIWCTITPTVSADQTISPANGNITTAAWNIATTDFRAALQGAGLRQATITFRSSINPTLSWNRDVYLQYNDPAIIGGGSRTFSYSIEIPSTDGLRMNQYTISGSSVEPNQMRVRVEERACQYR